MKETLPEGVRIVRVRCGVLHNVRQGVRELEVVDARQKMQEAYDFADDGGDGAAIRRDAFGREAIACEGLYAFCEGRIEPEDVWSKVLVIRLFQCDADFCFVASGTVEASSY